MKKFIVTIALLLAVIPFSFALEVGATMGPEMHWGTDYADASKRRNSENLREYAEATDGTYSRECNNGFEFSAYARLPVVNLGNLSIVLEADAALDMMSGVTEAYDVNIAGQRVAESWNWNYSRIMVPLFVGVDFMKDEIIRLSAYAGPYYVKPFGATLGYATGDNDETKYLAEVEGGQMGVAGGVSAGIVLDDLVMFAGVMANTDLFPTRVYCCDENGDEVLSVRLYSRGVAVRLGISKLL